MPPLRILAGSYTDAIYTLQFDPPPDADTSPALKLLGVTHVGDRPSWIASHPSDRSLIFAVLEQVNGEIVVIKYGQGPVGEVMARAQSGGKDPCTLVVLEDELIIGNVSSQPLVYSNHQCDVGPVFLRNSSNAPNLDLSPVHTHPQALDVVDAL